MVHDEEAKSNVTAEDLHKFGKAAYEVLEEYMQVFGHHNIFIVTNGAAQWVVKSLQDLSELFQQKVAESKKSKISTSKNGENQNQNGNQNENGILEDYFAAIYNSFIDLGIHLISAQALHSGQYPQQTTLWKTMVFKKIVKEHFNLKSARDDVIQSIVSIGDSETEFVASYEAKCLVDTRNRLNCTNNISRLHRIKLRARPTLNDMLEQFAFLKEHAVVIYEETGSSTIRYE